MSDRESVRAEWSSGDYPAIAARLAPAADALVAAAAIAPGMEVLDVATGTGNTALRAARAGASVVGVDLTEELLERARRDAAAEGLDVDFLTGDAEALEFEEDRFDCVLSSFGAIFAPRPAVAAGELARVCTPGGLVAVTTWPLDSVPVAMFRALAPFVPPRPDAPPPSMLSWAAGDRIRELFAGRGIELAVERRTDLVWRFADLEEAAAFFEATSGSLQAVIGSTDEPQAVRAALREGIAALARDDADGIALGFDYLLAVGRKVG